jgi:hypothetical protein
MEIILHNLPSEYCSFYLHGLYKHSSISNIKYQITHPKYNGTAYIILSLKMGTIIKRIVIENNDPSKPIAELLSYCDYYFCTNYIENTYNVSTKVIPLYPHFPIRYLKPYMAQLAHFYNLPIKQKKHVLSSIKYLYQLPNYAINKAPALHNFKNVFFASTIWKKEDGTNKARYKFMSVVKNISQLDFEGGFSKRSDNNNMGYDAFLMPKRISPKEYKSKVINSVINFNCPAVCNAISWRLGEFLNLGKFIFSTPLQVKLPEPLIHGEHLWLVTDDANWLTEINYLLSKPKLINEIEFNALQYFNNKCDSIKQIDYIISHL